MDLPETDRTAPTLSTAHKAPPTPKAITGTAPNCCHIKDSPLLNDNLTNLVLAIDLT